MPLTVDDGQEIIRRFCTYYPVACKVSYLVRNTQEEAFHEKATIEKYGKLYGAFFPASRIAAFACANFSDEAHFKGTLRHEILGHFGINTFRPADKRAILNAIIDDKSQPGLDYLWGKIDTHYGHLSELQKAEEVYAFACEAIE